MVDRRVSPYEKVSRNVADCMYFLKLELLPCLRKYGEKTFFGI
ncbi:hypothetical protein HMPREF9554_03173 [Treponema phagedenis F0421]|nr:hypothetical protein HMPREF9554_03173 [Treponema phagedenis F0421]